MSAFISIYYKAGRKPYHEKAKYDAERLGLNINIVFNRLIQPLSVALRSVPNDAPTPCYITIPPFRIK